MSDVVPSSGALSFQDLRAGIEIGTGPLSLNDPDVRSLCGRSFYENVNGLISANDFRGKGGQIQVTTSGQWSKWSGGGYQYASFWTSGSINVTAGFAQMEIFVLGGGGGGGAGRHGGGGGSGAAAVFTCGIGPGLRSITVGALGVEMPKWTGMGVWDPSASGTVGGTSSVAYTTASARGGGTQKDPKPGGSGAGENSSDFGAGTGLGASPSKTTGGNPGGQGAYIPTGTPNQFLCGGGGGVTGAGGNAVVNPGNNSTTGRGGNGSTSAGFLPGWSISNTYWSSANSFGGGGAGSSGQPSARPQPANFGGGKSTANTGGNATATSGGGGAGGRFNGSTNFQGGNGAAGVVIVRWIG